MPYRRIGLIRTCLLAVTMLAAAPIAAFAQSPDDQPPDSADNGASASPSQKPPQSADSDPALPSLDQMLKVAMERHPDIRAARAELSVAEANLDRTRLKVVKELTSFRDRWHVAHTSLKNATEKLDHTKRLAAKGFVSEVQVEAEQLNVETLQLQLREMEAELPFLIGGALDADSSAGGSPQDLQEQAAPIAEQILSLALESYRSGDGDLDRCVEWSTRLMRIHVETAQSDADRHTAAAAHLQRLEAIKDLATARFQAGEASIEDRLIAEFAILEARALLKDAE